MFDHLIFKTVPVCRRHKSSVKLITIHKSGSIRLNSSACDAMKEIDPEVKRVGVLVTEDMSHIAIYPIRSEKAKAPKILGCQSASLAKALWVINNKKIKLDTYKGKLIGVVNA